MRLAPQTLSQVAAALGRAGGARGMHLVRGLVLPELPRGAQPLPSEPLPPELQEDRREVVCVRIELSESMPYARPLLRRVDLGRDFFIGDETGRALVRVGDDLELHLGGAFASQSEEADEDGSTRTSYARAVRTGDEVYVWGRASLDPGGEAAGYREAPLGIVLAATTSDLLHVYDEAAFAQLSAWRALPWYRKLSVLVRNR